MLLRGADKVFPPREDNKDYSSLREAMCKNMSAHAFFSDAITEESTKGLLPIASLDVSSFEEKNDLVLCDSISTHSLVSATFVKRLNLIGTPVSLNTIGYNSRRVMEG